MMIRARCVTHAYGTGDPVLRDVDLDAARAEFVAITGSSGRGKSTLLFIVAMLLRPTGGEIEIGGTATRLLTDRQRSAMRAQWFGYLFQDAALDPSRTVLDNVLEPRLYARRANRAHSRTRAIELLERFGVAARSSARPGQISGGQAQRIALCRALLLEPPIVIADEPTASLDGSSADVVIDALRQQTNAGNTVLVATHDERVVAACDRVVPL